LYRQPKDADSVERLVQSSNDDVLAELTPDGKWVFYWSTPPGGNDSVMRLRTDGGASEKLLQIDEANVQDSPFHCPLRSGSCVLYRPQLDQLVFYALDPVQALGEELARTQLRVAFEMMWAVSPDGMKIAIANTHELRGRLRLIDRRTQSEKDLTVPHNWRVVGLAWVHDSSGLFAAVNTGKYFLARVGLDGKIRVLLDRGRNQFLQSPLPSPDGRYLAFGEQSFGGNFWLRKISE
jgi:hypothetical protein